MDIKFGTNNTEFHLRVGGVIIKDDKLLISRCVGNDNWHIPGGHVEIGETTGNALIREIREELSLDVAIDQLFCINENFFKSHGHNCHGVEFYYTLAPKTDIAIENGFRNGNPNNPKEQLEVKWVTFDELNTIDLRPRNIKHLLIDGHFYSFSHLVKLQD